MRIFKVILCLSFSFLLMACEGKVDFLAKVPPPVPANKDMPPVLQGLGQILGQVTDEVTGLALPDVRVEIFKLNEVSFSAWAHTDFRGSYEVSGLAPGTYSVQIKKRSYLDFKSKTLGALGGGQIQKVDASLKQIPSAISGRVRDKFSYANLGQVQVQLIDQKNLAVVKTVQTDSYGYYSIPNIYLGNYSMLFLKQGYMDFASSQPAQISIAQNFNVNADLEPKKIVISGTVTSTTFQALASVTVQVLSTSGSIVTTAMTDTQGRYSISNLNPNHYTMRFTLPGYENFLSTSPGPTVGGDSYTVNAVMKAQMAKVMGSVVDASTARALAGVRVRLLDTATGVVVSEAMTDQYGQYAINDLLAGNYKLLFTVAHYSDFNTPQPGAVLFGNTYRVDAALSRQLEAGQYRIVLTWTSEIPGAVKDVDSYLSVPGFERPIFYSNRTPAGANANLDVDDTTWSGPETVTIDSVFTGTYHYYIGNFTSPSDGIALGNSKVAIQVYGAAGLIKQYALNGGCGSIYEFFRIENGVIRDVKQYNQTLWVSQSAGPTNCP